MLLEELVTIDFHSLTKIQLRDYCKKARALFRRTINLRIANINEMIDYLQSFLQWRKNQPILRQQEQKLYINFEAQAEYLFARAIAALRNDNSNVVSGDGLSQLLREIRDLRLKDETPTMYPSLKNPEIYANLVGVELDNFSLYKRVMADPSEFVDKIPEDVKPDIERMNLIGRLISTSGVVEMLTYHTIRDRVQDLQKMFGVSSLKMNQKKIRGVDIGYLIDDSQLLMLESDRQILKTQTQAIAEDFLRLVKMPEKYSLCEIESDSGDNEHQIPCTYAKVIEKGKSAVCAWINSDSRYWEQSQEGGWFGKYVEREHPDTISLFVPQSWDKNGESDDFVEFRAMHPDTHTNRDRFPWGGDE